MQGRYYDGAAPVAIPAAVAVEDGALVIRLPADVRRWPLAAVEVEALGPKVRLSPGLARPERLLLEAAAWRALAGGRPEAGRVQRGRHRKLVLGLALVAAGLAGFVFVGLPALSGPLAARTPPQLERQIGDNFEAQVSLAFPTCNGQAGQDALYVFGDRLEGAARTPFNVRVRAVQAPMANAFALPGGAILVTDDLIALAQTPDELAAVIAHEVAHVERRDVMQAVWRSLGLGLLLDAVVGGGSGAGQQAVLLMGSVTDLRYSRAAEAAADAEGQALLQAEGLSSQGMAPFFERLAAKGEATDAAAVKELLSDHPDTLRRARLARSRAKPGEPAFSPEDWRAIKAVCARTPGRLDRLRRVF